MTRDEELDWLYRLRSNIYVYMPKEWLIPMNNALDGAIKALEQEPTTKNDLALIHTEGLDEEIRCTMCTNYMKSDRGCDGSCVVNNDMYKAVMDAIEKRIQPTTTTLLVTPQEPRWIPVSERLPEENGGYLITLKGGYVMTALWSGNAEYWSEVTAWMPLPKLYEPQESEVEDGNED